MFFALFEQPGASIEFLDMTSRLKIYRIYKKQSEESFQGNGKLETDQPCFYARTKKIVPKKNSNDKTTYRKRDLENVSSKNPHRPILRILDCSNFDWRTIDRENYSLSKKLDCFNKSNF